MSSTGGPGERPATLAIVLALVPGTAVSVIYGVTAGSALSLPIMIVVDVVVGIVILAALVAVRVRRSRSSRLDR